MMHATGSGAISIACHRPTRKIGGRNDLDAPEQGRTGALHIEEGGASQMPVAAFDSSEPVGELVPQPSIRLPSQIGATCPRFVAELGLIAAILEEAFRTVSRQGGRLRQRRAAAEAYEWFFEEDQKWPFAFQNVCDLLGLDAQALRACVLGELEERRREARPRATPPTRPPKGR
jgi:hypothetical protein